MKLSPKGEGDIIFYDLGSYVLDYFMDYTKIDYLSVQDKNLPLPVKLPKIKVIETPFIYYETYSNLTDGEYIQLRVKIYNELQNVKLKSEAMELMERYWIEWIEYSIDYSTICKNAAWYEFFKNSSAYERLKAIDDWVTKTKSKKEADKRKIPILNFKK